jgi:hypothetical protein
MSNPTGLSGLERKKQIFFAVFLFFLIEKGS